MPPVPIEREAVDGDNVYGITDAPPKEVADEQRVDRRNTTQHARQARRHTRQTLAGQADHFREQGPLRVLVAVPVRQVVRFVPQHHRLDHEVAARGSQTYTSWQG